MSAGSTVATRYQTDSGAIVPIRLQPESIAFAIGETANEPPEGSADASYPSAKASGSKRSIGINARKVNIKFDTAPTGYKQDGLISIPVLQKSVWDTIAKSQAGTYLGEDVTVVSKSPEYLV